MSPRIDPLRPDPILFAHRGARAHAPENTIEAFELAIRLGANGLESDVWVTTDGVAIMVHDDEYGGLIRRRRVSTSEAGDLPEEMPTLDGFFDALGTDFELSLDIKDPAAIDATVDAVRRASDRHNTDMVQRTWLCHPDLELLGAWRSRWSDLRLVHSTRLGRLRDGPERHAAQLFEQNIDAVNFRFPDWSGGLVALYHRFERFSFGWDAQLEREANELLDMGLDGIFGDHVDRLIDARAAVYGE